VLSGVASVEVSFGITVAALAAIHRIGPHADRVIHVTCSHSRTGRVLDAILSALDGSVSARVALLMRNSLIVHRRR
jgi:hypothetical protein